MSGKELSPEDHVVRYVKPSSMHKERVDSSEFQLNPHRTDLTKLSTSASFASAVP